jgi:hypothetical protein
LGPECRKKKRDEALA